MTDVGTDFEAIKESQRRGRETGDYLRVGDTLSANDLVRFADDLAAVARQLNRADDDAVGVRVR